MSAITQATEGQIKQISRHSTDFSQKLFGEKNIRELLDELGIGQPGAQQLIERGDSIRIAVEKALRDSFVEFSVTDRFTKERIPDIDKSSYLSTAYTPGEITLEEQVLALLQYFKLESQGIKPPDKNRKIPFGEGWFAIPRWQSLDKAYTGALSIAIMAMNKAYGEYIFADLCVATILKIERNPRLESTLKSLSTKDCSVVVAPGQFGLGHKGESVRCALECSHPSELPIGLFEAICFILSHKKKTTSPPKDRFGHPHDLGITCGADIIKLDDGKIVVPSIHVDDKGMIVITTNDVSEVNPNYGMPTIFRI